MTVLQGEQDGAPPLTADPQALTQAQKHKNKRRGNTDGGIAGQESDDQRRDAHQ